RLPNIASIESSSAFGLVKTKTKLSVR
ncbi:Lrp/AsnC family transcriptional regulator, partial [Vibrio splendidus]